jgi:hypothetical protein
MPPAHQQRQRRKVATAASRKKCPDSQRGDKATRNQQNGLYIPLRERPPLWMALELGPGSRRDGIWLAPKYEKA